MTPFPRGFSIFVVVTANTHRISGFMEIIVMAGISMLFSQKIPPNQYVTLILLYVMGSAVLFPLGGPAKSDVWLAIILGLIQGMVMCLPFLLLSVRFPGLGVSGINDMVWGKYIGKIFTVVFIGYTFQLASLVGTDIIDFVQLSILADIPDDAFTAVTAVSVIIAVIYGIECLGRYSLLITPIIIGNIILVTLLALPYMDVNNFRPVLDDPIPRIPLAANTLAAFPFAEVIVFAALIPHLTTPKNSIKYTYLGLFLGGIILFVLNVRSLLILGDTVPYYTHPAYTVARIVNVAGVFTRMEILVALNHTLSCFLKLCVLVYVTSATIVELLNLKSIKSVAIPLGYVAILLGKHNFSSGPQNAQYSTTIYPIIAPIVQFGLPLLTLIIAIILKKKHTIER